MNRTGTVIASLLVGVAIGFGVARLLTPACGHQLIVINPAGPNPLPDRCVSKSAGNRVVWQSSNGAPMEVAWVSIENPPSAPFPYSFNCTNAPSASCSSGPMSSNAVVGSKARYRAKFLPSGPEIMGRIIIDP